MRDKCYVHALKNNSSLPQSCVAASLTSRAVNSTDGRVERCQCASSDRARSWRRKHTTETDRRTPAPWSGDARCASARSWTMRRCSRSPGRRRASLSSVDPRVPAEVAEVRPLVGTARELADRGGLASVLPVVTGDGAGIGTRVVALPTLVRPLESVAVPHVTLKVP